MYVASCRGRLGAVRLLRRRMRLTELDVANDDGQTPLFCAARRNRTEALAYLLAQGANAGVKDDLWMSPIYAAAYYGLDGVVEMLLNGE